MLCHFKILFQNFTVSVKLQDSLSSKKIERNHSSKIVALSESNAQKAQVQKPDI